MIEKKSTQRWIIPPKGLKFLILVLLILSLCFRFFDIGNKNYWGDETVTSLRIAGYRNTETTHLFDGREVSVDEIQKFQQINSQKKLSDTVNSLKEEDPNPPLYFMMAHVWGKIFGDSVWIRRSLSVIFSLLSLPLTYWLCLELFNSPIVSWMGVMIMSVSPMQLLYAQEIREYSLWTVTILVSSATLLQAMRTKTTLNWFFYALTVAFSLYSFSLSVLVLAAHGFYVLITRIIRLHKSFLPYLLSSVGGIVLYFPWLYVLIVNFSTIVSTNSDKDFKEPFSYLLKTWLYSLIRVFFDIQFDYQDPFRDFNYDNLFTYLIVPTLILIGYSLYYLYRNTPLQISLFIFILIGVTGGAIIVPDIIFGKSASITTRYFFPAFLGIQLTVAYLLASKIIFKVKFWQRFWQSVMILVISLSTFSCFIMSQMESSWIKYSDYYNPQIASIVNQSEHPLLILENPWRTLPISYLLEPKVKIQVFYTPFYKDKKFPPISEKFSDVFVFNTYNNRSPQFREKFEEEFQVKLVRLYEGKLSFRNRLISLWKIKK